MLTVTTVRDALVVAVQGRVIAGQAEAQTVADAILEHPAMVAALGGPCTLRRGWEEPCGKSRYNAVHVEPDERMRHGAHVWRTA